MIPLKVDLEGDGCWPDLKPDEIQGGVIEGMAWLDNGTVEGNPTVALRIKTASGQTVIAETTMKLFLTAAAAFVGKADRLGMDCWRGPVRKE